MIIETRQIATVDEIRAIELKCPKHGCGGLLEIDLRPGCISDEEHCPRCKRTWWTPTKSTPTLELVKALTDMRHGQHANPGGPIVRLVLPEPESSVE